MTAAARIFSIRRVSIRRRRDGEEKYLGKKVAYGEMKAVASGDVREERKHCPGIEPYQIATKCRQYQLARHQVSMR